MRKEPMNNSNAQGKSGPSGMAIWGALIAVYIAWGSTYLAIRFAVETMPPFLMAATRFLFAGGVLYAFRRLRGDPAPTRIEWRSAAIVGLLLLAGANGSVVWAEQLVVSGIAALMVGSAPLWMVLIDALRPGGHWPDWKAVVGVVVGFGGIALLVWPSNGLQGEVNPVGAGVLVLASILWAIGSLYSRGAELPDSPLLGTGMEMLAGGAGLVIMGTLNNEWSQINLAGISTRSLLGLAYLIVGGAWVGFAAYTWLLRVAPTTLVSTYAYVNPLIAIFMGNLLASEPLTTRILIAAAIIVTSVALITMTRGRGNRRETGDGRRGRTDGKGTIYSAGDD
jgi:drug/metabolite transporter (DMT)-like permease